MPYDKNLSSQPTINTIRINHPFHHNHKKPINFSILSLNSSNGCLNHGSLFPISCRQGSEACPFNPRAQCWTCQHEEISQQECFLWKPMVRPRPCQVLGTILRANPHLTLLVNSLVTMAGTLLGFQLTQKPLQRTVSLK
jgi:hypothetical protein